MLLLLLNFVDQSKEAINEINNANVTNENANALEAGGQFAAAAYTKLTNSSKSNFQIFMDELLESLRNVSI